MPESLAEADARPVLHRDVRGNVALLQAVCGKRTLWTELLSRRPAAAVQARSDPIIAVVRMVNPRTQWREPGDCDVSLFDRDGTLGHIPSFELGGTFLRASGTVEFIGPETPAHTVYQSATNWQENAR